MKDYKIPVKFVFEGYFFVSAENKHEAEKIVKKDCGMVMDRGIHTSNDEAIIDWEFPCHPEKKINSSKIKLS